MDSVRLFDFIYNEFVKKGDVGGALVDELETLVDRVTEEDPVVTFPAPDPTEIGSDETIATTIDQF